MEKVDISSMTLPQLTEWVTGTLGEPKFRAGQIYRWIHQKRAGSFAEMTNLSTALRQKLEERAFLTVLTTRRRLESKLDETVKLLLELPDQNCVEAVLMRYEHGLSLCISTQVGCRMGCKFCASTLGGLVRSLTPAEMLGEVYEAERQAGEPISSLVLMGIGEPLDNYRNVLDFLTILSSPEGRNLSLRHVSLSTCGLCDRIDELAELGLGLTLSISLHAADDETRSGIMPVNKQYNIARLMQSCKNYFAKTGRRISYEYALIAGANRAVYTRSGQSGGALTGMGSTLCAAVISDGVALVANVGDSRCYLLRQGELIQVTEDHTAVAVLLRQGLLSPEEAAHHPDRHAITRAIGVEPEVQPDYTVIDLLRGDALLLCSDGLYNTLPPGELAGTLQEILQGGDIHTLIAKANAAGGPDNITAVLIHNR